MKKVIFIVLLLIVYSFSHSQGIVGHASFKFIVKAPWSEKEQNFDFSFEGSTSSQVKTDVTFHRDSTVKIIFTGIGKKSVTQIYKWKTRTHKSNSDGYNWDELEIMNPTKYSLIVVVLGGKKEITDVGLAIPQTEIMAFVNKISN